MTHHDLLFPVEFQVRELDARLVLAAAALRRGERRVFLGTDPYLEQVVATLENGVYIGKSIRPYFTSNVTHYAKLKRANIRLLHLDEEGAVYMGGEHEWRQQLQARLAVTKLGPKDFVCAWGRFQASVFHELAHAAGPQVKPTGHPRLDLPKESYRALYAEEVADLRSRYGSDFVLVNGNYPRANHGLGIDTSSVSTTTTGLPKRTSGCSSWVGGRTSRASSPRWSKRRITSRPRFRGGPSSTDLIRARRSPPTAPPSGESRTSR